MHTHSTRPWAHDHTFGQDQHRLGERRTMIVISITALMMMVEIVAGLLFGSMALLADGLHMGSHTAALGLALFAYIYARRHSKDERFSFGTGKVNALSGFAGAILLAGFAALMAVESIKRLFDPVAIGFNQAIAVAAVGLLVNGVSVVILGRHGAESGHEHSHHHDHNLRSAYLHVLADALTSVLAIFALLAGKYFGASWLDPTMGVVGAILVGNWSRGLLRQSSRVLLDRQAPESIRDAVRKEFEEGTDRVADLHVWSVGPGIYAAEVSVVTNDPKSPAHYKVRLPGHLGLVHVTVEVHGFDDAPDGAI